MSDHYDKQSQLKLKNLVQGDTSSFPVDNWDVQGYLNDYYPEDEVPSDEEFTNQFFVRELSAFRKRGDIAIVGTGPTADDLILAAKYARKHGLYASDYLSSNLDVLRKWLTYMPEIRNWHAYTRNILTCEGVTKPTLEQINEREAMTRRKTVGLLRADLRDPDPLGKKLRGAFSVVIMPYCADSATDDKKEWRTMMHNAASLVQPGGMFLVGALMNCTEYFIGDKRLPGANVSLNDMEKQLQLDFPQGSVSIMNFILPEHKPLGYEGIILARASKSA